MVTKMSPEVFAAHCDATVDGALPQVRWMLGAAPRDGVLAYVATSLHEAYETEQLGPLAAAALIRLIEEQDAHAKTRSNFEEYVEVRTDEGGGA